MSREFSEIYFDSQRGVHKYYLPVQLLRDGILRRLMFTYAIVQVI